MLTRFTADLQEIAQGGGLSLSISAFSGDNEMLAV